MGPTDARVRRNQADCTQGHVIAAMIATPTLKPTSELIPVDAATLVLVDRTRAEPRILMGRRSPNLAFMPNKFVFPGGRVDVADLAAPSASELKAAVFAKLQIGVGSNWHPARARALGIAAIRETREETGVIVGQADTPPLAALQFFSRAITPPDQPRRFDTRFFMADAALATHTVLAGDGELSEIAWVTLAAMGELELPNITRLIVADIAAVLAADADQPAGIPFYQNRHGQTHRTWL